jgi:hypothetical protein
MNWNTIGAVGEIVGNLADAESMRFVISTCGLFRAWEEAFIQNRDGHLNTEAWEAVTRHYALSMGRQASVECGG